MDEEAMESRIVSKKEAARRQIVAAIKLFYEGEYECAITLAGAAEGQFPATESDASLFATLMAKRPEEFAYPKDWRNQLNDVLYWLKHNYDQGNRTITEFEAWIMLARALTKYQVHYGEEAREMSDFMQWAREQKLTARKP